MFDTLEEAKAACTGDEITGVVYVPTAPILSTKATPPVASPAEVAPVPSAAKKRASTSAEASPASANAASTNPLISRLEELIAEHDAETEEICHHSEMYDRFQRENPDADASKISFMVMKEMLANPVDFAARVREKTADLIAARDGLIAAERVAAAVIAKQTGESLKKQPAKKVAKVSPSK